jgi:hypothetical protein
LILKWKKYFVVANVSSGGLFDQVLEELSKITVRPLVLSFMLSVLLKFSLELYLLLQVPDSALLRNFSFAFWKTETKPPSLARELS